MVEQKEIDEARSVALQVVDLLNEVERNLKSAKNWGIYDLLGGGFLSSLIKHRKIDRAESLLRNVHACLVRLQKELGDIDLSLDSTVGISSFQRFMDIAFDNVIADWMTQSRINESLNDVVKIKAEVQGVLETLDRIERNSI